MSWGQISFETTFSLLTIYVTILKEMSGALLLWGPECSLNSTIWLPRVVWLESDVENANDTNNERMNNGDDQRLFSLGKHYITKGEVQPNENGFFLPLWHQRRPHVTEINMEE